MENENPKKENTLKDHEYDGIRELNNPAPAWWQLIFYGCIVWGIGYTLYYTVMNGPSLDRELAQDLLQIQIAQSKAQAAAGTVSETALVALVKDPAAVSRGKATFDSKCASCHGPTGGGLVGPNLTDNAWINGNGSLVAIHLSVDKGVADKGMPPWGPLLKTDELNEVVAYIGSIRGTNVAGGKPPQGTAVK